MNLLKTPVIFILCLFFLTCGIDEYYYLPQLSENSILSQNNTRAEINIPSNSLNQAYYATGYIIFYKIYISNLEINSVNDIISSSSSTITNSSIYRDYKYLEPYTDPSNTTSITLLNTFSGRGFYELDLEGINIRDTVLSKNGGTFDITFPTRPGEEPFINYNGNDYFLLRSNGSKEGGTPFNPIPEDRYFFNSDDLKNYTNATSTINADVSGIPQTEVNAQTDAYASMYIVAVGQNPTTFARLYGKPTFISIFKLTPLY